MALIYFEFSHQARKIAKFIFLSICDFFKVKMTFFKESYHKVQPRELQLREARREN